ncbi:DNA invertase Pin-like site-specific DNA recombinase [Clostridium moniliforme]|uniref:DNA invertase Pin-like site-specific DNA recombinase n=1 Tax=Clostridium moniliforme TaxID=39489 RepID=A0ABS4F0L0_9CLOT|nr:DNA invertase Pin-like site-specific DNA recombinase [Clostridium moniliforme]
MLRGNINQIIEDYENRKIKVPNILKKYSITKRELDRIRKDYNLNSRKKRLTDEEIEEMLKLYKEGLDTNLIVKKFKTTITTLHKYRRLHNIPKREKIIKELDKKIVNKIQKYYRIGLENKDIAKLVAKDKNRKSFIVLMYQSKIIKPMRRKPVPKEIKERILQELAFGRISNKDIATKYNVSAALVSRLAHGECI